MKRILQLLLALSTGLLIPGQAAAQPAGGATEVDMPDTVEPGRRVTVTGTGWESASQVTITFPGAQPAVTTTDDEGRFSTSIRIPQDARTGDEVEVLVEGTDANGTPITMPISVEVGTGGSPRGAWVLVALAAGVMVLILIVGGVLLMRRRTAAPEAERGGSEPVVDPELPERHRQAGGSRAGRSR